MNAPSEIKICDFDYHLPEENIAKYPLQERDKAKLLCLDADKNIEDCYFYEIVDKLDSNTFLILNDTKVVHARLLFQKDSGSTIEIFCLEPYPNSDVQLAYAQKGRCIWKCLVGNNKGLVENCIVKAEFDAVGDAYLFALNHLVLMQNVFVKNRKHG